jgi:carboxyl-terminal processing protease
VDLTDDQRQKLWIGEREKVATLADPQFAKAVEALGKEIAGKGTTRAGNN